MHDRLSDAQMRAIARTNGVSEDALDSYVKAWVMSLAEQGDKAGTYIEQDGIEPDPNQVEAGPSDMLIDNVASSTDMYYLLDPVLSKCTAHEPIAINAELVALTGIQVINAPIDIELTADNNYNYLGYSHDDVMVALTLRRIERIAHHCLRRLEPAGEKKRAAKAYCGTERRDYIYTEWPSRWRSTSLA